MKNAMSAKRDHPEFHVDDTKSKYFKPTNDCVEGGRKLERDDFDKPGEELAKYMLGKVLYRRTSNEMMCGRIVETEAYLGEIDAACHSHAGKRTERTKPMYETAGTSYVYSIYGMYHCFNISSKDAGGCVLVRALEPIQGVDSMIKNRSAKRKSVLKFHELCNGPSKLCQALNITKKNLNSVYMATSGDFFVCDDGFTCGDVINCKRIGIEGYGKESAEKLYRYYLLGNRCVSVRDKTIEASTS